MTMKLPLTGGCECGAVRYECTEPPMLMFKCHCATCQKVTGSAYAPVMIIPSKAFKITKGALRYHFTDSVRGEKHPNKRGFCPDCGTRITGAESIHKRPWLGITASSLDDPSVFRPEYDIFTSHAQAWDLMDPSLPKHELHRPNA